MIVFKIDLEKKHKISPYLYMQFMEPLGVADSSVDVGWDFTENRWWPMLMDRVKELAPTMVRWGGSFASYYHWREAVGPRDRRVPMFNHCWGGIYHNQVGTHEVLDFCRQANAAPLLVVNMESEGLKFWQQPKNDTNRMGTAQEAADWVAYCNDPENPERLAHGIKAPYNVKYWQIGNETSYGIWKRPGFTVEECYEATARFAEAMKAKDSSIHLIGWGDEDLFTKEAWAPTMSRLDQIEMLAFHHHFDSGLPDSPLNSIQYRDDLEKTWLHLLNAHKSLDEHIKKMRNDAGNKHLAITEGHFGLKGRNRCEVLSSWGAGVAYARCLNTIMRHSDVVDIATMADFFGNVWQVNAILVSGVIREHDSGQKCYLQPVGSVMSLFRHHQGEYYLDCSYNGALDAVCSATENKVYIHVANTDMNYAQELKLDVGGRKIQSAEMFYIAENPATEITPLNQEVFAVQTQPIEGDIVKLPPATVAAIEITLV